MQFTRVVAWLFAAAVAGAWFASAAGVSRSARQQRMPVPPAGTAAVEHLAADVQAQATRLRQRLENAPAPKTPLRNPFRFSERAPSVRTVRPTSEPAYVPPPPVAPVEPALELIGVAEKKVGDGLVRTAMMAAGDADNLIMATVGQRILGVYEVVAVGADAVELKDLATGATRRLILR